MFRAPFPGGKFQKARLHGSFDVFSDSTAWLAACLTNSLYIRVAKRQPMRGRVIAHNFQVPRPKSPRSFKVFAVSAPWIRAYVTDSFRMWHNCDPCG